MPFGYSHNITLSNDTQLKGENVESSWSCNNCGNLDKSKKEVSNGWYCYGCKDEKRFKTKTGWMEKDSGLNNMGCSSWIEKSARKSQQIRGQLSMF